METKSGGVMMFQIDRALDGSLLADLSRLWHGRCACIARWCLHQTMIPAQSWHIFPIGLFQKLPTVYFCNLWFWHRSSNPWEHGSSEPCLMTQRWQIDRYLGWRKIRLNISQPVLGKVKLVMHWIERNKALLIVRVIGSIFQPDPIDANLAAKVNNVRCRGIGGPHIIGAIIQQHVAGRVIGSKGRGREIESQRWRAGGRDGWKKEKESKVD